MGVSFLQPPPEAAPSREIKLFGELSWLMESERLFSDPTLDRRTLSELLCTNDKYLADAVRSGAGTTVAAYISDCRLSYSLQLLSSHYSMPLDIIAEKSGHGSYSSFFRAFLKKYGMTPSDYRRLSKNNMLEKPASKRREKHVFEK